MRRSAPTGDNVSENMAAVRSRRYADKTIPSHVRMTDSICIHALTMADRCAYGAKITDGGT